jgi:hypothetical protein
MSTKPRVVIPSRNKPNHPAESGEEKVLKSDVAENDQEETEEEAEESEEENEEEESEEKASEETHKAKKSSPAAKLPGDDEKTVGEVSAPSVKIRKESSDLVKVVMLRGVSPAPRVGQYNLPMDFNLPKLEQGKTYRVPRVVAEHLTDAKAGQIIG